MEHVTIVGTEDNLLVLATESGTRFALPVDEVLRAEIRRARARQEERAAPLAASPREIQAQIRAGLSAREVAELLGVRVEDVEKFEGPVLAEREHIVGQALAVPVLIGSEVEPDAQPTFGVAIRAKLADVGATAERWASWKDESGWIIKLEFTASEVDHDARWSFDPRRSVLSPLNADATQLSRQGSLPEGLIPRLRALDKERPSPYKDDSRFDSGAFGPRLVPAPSESREDGREENAAPQRSAPAVQEAATNRAPQVASTPSDTADLLEALRRRRGQREPAPSADETDEAPIALFDALEPGYRAGTEDTTPDPAPQPSAPASHDESGSRRRRREMPSWDEIVFGARTDD
ncbi:MULTISPECIES: septation protein SepH [Microbacterium]|uniref:septation protein SepH n=1 Tax=Microbacterium TaxID=33882 RepID=UPI0022F0B76D|nr:septation protein SepH [Streptomyces sp. MS2A]